MQTNSSSSTQIVLLPEPCRSVHMSSIISSLASADDSTTTTTTTAATLLKLSRHCHANLIRQYSTPRDRDSTRQLLVDTNRCYAQLHYLWHHPPLACSISLLNDLSADRLTAPDALQSLIERSTSVAGEATISDAVDSCALYCEKYDHNQRRHAKFAVEQRKNAARRDQTAGTEPKQTSIEH